MGHKGKILILISFGVLASFAGTFTFGTPDEIKASHPEFFNPQNVSVVTSVIPQYVYCGRARLRFKQSPVATVRANEVARLQAENNLSRFVSKGMNSRTLTLRGNRLIAKDFADGWVTCVYAVPVEGVKVNEQPNVSPLPPATAPLVPPAKNSLKPKEQKHQATK